MSLVALLLVPIISWSPSDIGCRDGRLLLFPEQVSYMIPVIVRAMAFDPACPTDETGVEQPCAMAVAYLEAETSATTFDIGAPPHPIPGVVYEYGFPIATNPHGRSDLDCP